MSLTEVVPLVGRPEPETPAASGWLGPWPAGPRDSAAIGIQQIDGINGDDCQGGNLNLKHHGPVTVNGPSVGMVYLTAFRRPTRRYLGQQTSRSELSLNIPASWLGARPSPSIHWRKMMIA